MAKEKDLELGRLCNAMQKARLQDRFGREKMAEMVKESTGSHYSDNGADKETPINLLALYERVVSRNLIAKNPRVKLSTFEKSDKPTMAALNDSVNDTIKKIRLVDTLRQSVINGLYSMGIVQVALATPADSAMTGWNLKAGSPFAMIVDRDDFVWDIHAREISKAGFVGNRLRLPLDVIKKMFGKKAKDIQPEPDPMYNLEGDERISMIGRGFYSDSEEYEDFASIWQVYLRRHKLIVTLSEDMLTGANLENNVYGKGRARALDVQKWIGPDCGPYHILGYRWISGNALPCGPIQEIYDLHLSVNNICRKLIREIRETKKITLFTGSDNDAQRINETPDGHSCRVDDPKQVLQIVLNEPIQALGLLMNEFIQRVSWLAGNLELMGGLAPQAKTLGQDKLNTAASSAGMADMQETTVNHVADVCEALCWFEHHHPEKITKSQYSIKGTGRSITRKTYPNNPRVFMNQPDEQNPGKAMHPSRLNIRNQPWEDMNARVDPYSIQHQTPQARLQFLDGVVTQVAPFMQLLQQQGVQFNVQKWIELKAELADSPDLGEIFEIGTPVTPDAGSSGGDQPPGAPPATTEHVRRSMGGDSQQAKEALFKNNASRQTSQNGQPQSPSMNGATA